jgi:hypothetical protein
LKIVDFKKNIESIIRTDSKDFYKEVFSSDDNKIFGIIDAALANRNDKDNYKKVYQNLQCFFANDMVDGEKTTSDINEFF